MAILTIAPPTEMMVPMNSNVSVGNFPLIAAPKTQFGNVQDQFADV